MMKKIEKKINRIYIGYKARLKRVLTWLMAVASFLGPTRRLVPVSRMASQPSVQVMVVSTPTVILKSVFERKLNNKHFLLPE